MLWILVAAAVGAAIGALGAAIVADGMLRHRRRVPGVRQRANVEQDRREALEALTDAHRLLEQEKLRRAEAERRLRAQLEETAQSLRDAEKDA